MPRVPIAITGWLALSLLSVGCGDRTGPKTATGTASRTPTRSIPYEPAAAPEPQLTEASGLTDYLTVAALNNREMQAAFHRWQAAVEQAPQVTSLPDPKLTYRYYIEEVETRVGPQRQSVQLAQTLPPLGTLRLRGEAADQAAAAARQRYEAAKLKVFYQVKNAYYEYYYLHRATELTRQNAELVGSIETIAAARYRADAGRHGDLIRAQVELGKLDDRLRTLQQLRDPMVVKLNAAMNRPPNAALPWPREIPVEPVTLTEAECRQWVAANNPQLRALDSEIARRRALVNLARKDYYPDVTLGLQWIDTDDAIGPMDPSDSGKDPVIAMVSVSIPLWRNKLDASLRRAKRLQAAATAEKVRTANELETQLAMVLYRLGDAERKTSLYRDTLIPKARQSVSATEAAYRSGKAGFIDLLDAVRVILEFQLAHERAVADHAQHVAALEMLVGRPIGAALNQSTAPAVLNGVPPSGG